MPAVGEAQQAIFDMGHVVGEVARTRHPDGVLVEGGPFDQDAMAAKTAELIGRGGPPAIFEATFEHERVVSRADLLVRAPGGRWDLHEVKGSAHVKDPNPDDLAIQYWVLTGAGIKINQAGILTLNRDYVYQGDDYDAQALFKFNDLKADARAKQSEVTEKVEELQAVLRMKMAPDIDIGEHCSAPYDCPFWEHCTEGMETLDNPITDLPNLSQKKKILLADLGVDVIEGIPCDFKLTEQQAHVVDCVVNNRAWASGELGRVLTRVEYPVHHLDFEAINPALPLYAGTHPFDAVPFQWSDHVESKNGGVEHREFLHEGSDDPRPAFVESLLENLGSKGTIFIWGSYEIMRMNELATEFPKQTKALAAATKRCVDMCQLVRKHYYHPGFHGSFSIKSVLPAVVPKMSYKGLDIQDGEAAGRAFMQARAGTDPREHRRILQALRQYCGMDTAGVVAIRQKLARS